MCAVQTFCLDFITTFPAVALLTSGKLYLAFGQATLHLPGSFLSLNKSNADRINRARNVMIPCFNSHFWLEINW